MNRMGGVRGRDQAIWSRSNDRAGDRAGARADKLGWVRILAITGGSSMAGNPVSPTPGGVRPTASVFAADESA